MVKIGAGEAEGDFELLLPQILFNFGEFSSKTNMVFEKSFKILNFGSNGMHLMFTVLVHFGAQFTTRKLKKLLKTNI